MAGLAACSIYPYDRRKIEMELTEAQELRIRVLLSLQSALMGEVHSSVRVIGVGWSHEHIRVWIFHEGEPDEDAVESASCVETRLLADFHPEHEVAVSAVEFPVDTPGPYPAVEGIQAWVYARWEPYWTRSRAEMTPEALVKPDALVKMVGFWRHALDRDDDDDDWRSLFPHPRLLQCPGWVTPDEKQDILSYLRSGNVSAEYMGYSSCRFEDGPESIEMGTRALTDGEWVWPEGLAIYVDRYDVKLPREFIATMKANRFRVPHLEVTYESKDGRFWIQWGRDNENK